MKIQVKVQSILKGQQEQKKERKKKNEDVNRLAAKSNNSLLKSVRPILQMFKKCYSRVVIISDIQNPNL